jgi:hypothetical protein
MDRPLTWPILVVRLASLNFDKDVILRVLSQESLLCRAASCPSTVGLIGALARLCCSRP